MAGAPAIPSLCGAWGGYARGMSGRRCSVTATVLFAKLVRVCFISVERCLSQPGARVGALTSELKSGFSLLTYLKTFLFRPRATILQLISLRGTRLA